MFVNQSQKVFQQILVQMIEKFFQFNSIHIVQQNTIPNSNNEYFPTKNNDKTEYNITFEILIALKWS